MADIEKIVIGKTDTKMTDRHRLLGRRCFFGSTFKAIGILGASTLFEQQAWAAALDFEPDMSGQDIGAGVLFAKTQMQMLAVLTDLVLPETTTPGGVELGVHQFLDHQLFTCYPQEDQQKVQALLLRLDEQSYSQHKKPFLDLDAEQRTLLLTALEALDLGFDERDKEVFQFTKLLMVFGYFTSEAGATEVLSYQAVPGKFIGSIPYSSVGKAWGSVDFY